MRFESLFSTDRVNANLARMTVHSTLITGTSQAVCLLLQIGSVVVLARLLRPADFGIVLMVNSVIGFLFVFKDLGLSMGSVQKEHINHEQVSVLFWINVAASLGLCLICIACAPLLASFYDKPELLLVTMVLAMAFIPNGLAAQHQAILKRQMRFFRLELANMISLISGIAVGITAALHGAGYWSLIYMHLTRPLVNTSCLWASTRWVPGLPRRASGTRSILAFGGYFSLFNSANFLLRNTDNILIGKCWGTESLGFYGKAYELLMMPLKVITGPMANVFVPALSRVQGEPARFASYYIQFLSALLLITTPIIMIYIVESHEIIDVILGPQWRKAGDIFYYLSFGGIAQALCSTSGWIYISLGRSRELLKYGLLGVAFFLISFIVGLPYGASGVAIAYSAAMIVWTVPCMAFATKDTPVSMRAVFAEFSIHVLGMVAGGCVICFSRKLLPVGLSPALALPCMAVFGCVAYYVTLLGVFGRWRILKVAYDIGTAREKTRRDDV